MTICTQLRIITDLTNFNPDVNECVETLPKINRWNGHTSVPFSVGAHTLHMFYCAVKHMKITDATLLLMILIHDFAECYIGDIITPIKDFCPRVHDTELSILIQLYEQLSIQPDTPAQELAIKNLDTRCAVTEHRDFFRTPPACPIPGQPFPELLDFLAAAHYTQITETLRLTFVNLNSARQCDTKMEQQLIQRAYVQVAALIGVN